MNTTKRVALPLLRPMQAGDVDAISDIESIVYSHGWSRRIFLDCMRTEYSNWVFETDTGIIGYGIMSVAVGEAHILNLAIDPHYQGHGMGRKMLSHLLRASRHGGAECVFLEVRASNNVALALYASAGFSQIGLRPGYYPSDNGREDAIVMMMELSADPL